MKKRYTLQLFVTYLLLISMSATESLLAQCPQRFVDRVFTETTPRPNIVYGGNKLNIDGTRTWLAFDMYEPKNDTAAVRPVIILMHGGGFTRNIPITRKSPDIQELAKDLSRRGYVVISPSYRLYQGEENFENIVRTIVSAFLDINELHCFLKESIENGNPYRLDSTQLFIGGSSAGAVLACNFGAFVNSVDVFEPRVQQAIRDVEAFDGVDAETILGNKFCGMRHKGIIAISGAFVDTNVVEPTDISFYFIHGGLDGALPYLQGNALGNPNLPVLYGPGKVVPMMETLDIDVTLDFYPDAYHVPVLVPFGDDLLLALEQVLNTVSIFNEPIMGNTKAGIARFCHRLMGSPRTTCRTATSAAENIIQGQLNIFPNPSSGRFNIELPVELVNKELRISVFDISGRLVLDERNWGSATAVFEIPAFSKGMHIVSVSEWDAQEGKHYLNKVIAQ